MSDDLQPTQPSPQPRGGLLHRLYHGLTEYDFVGRRRIGFVISGVLLLASVLSLATRGLDLSIEFDGGVAWELDTGRATTDDIRAVMAAEGLGDVAKIQTLRSSEGERFRVTVGPEPAEVQTRVREALAAAAGIPADDVSEQVVGPSWGEEITRQAVRALVFFFIAVAIYISLRFEWKMAIAALLAVVHDVVISVGIYSVFGFTVSPATVIAFLTILGFSLYDTIVVFDKVHDNTRKLQGGRFTYSDVVNLSMNQVLMRSINTSITSVLPVLSLLVVGSWLMGAVALEDFALALLIGLLTGSYSSIFVATPILAMLKERELRYRQLRERVQGRAPVSVVRAAASPGTSARPAAVPSGGQPGGPVPSAAAIPPRPRKKKKR